jgi:hypothetical protein
MKYLIGLLAVLVGITAWAQQKGVPGKDMGSMAAKPLPASP